MERMYVLLLLFLWANVDFTLTQEVCSQQLPTVEHAFALDEYKKVQYQKGDVIYHSCDPGYITGFNTSHICTENGWKYLTIGHCIKDDGFFPLRLGCAPPTLENGYIWKNKFYFYEDGQVALFRCNLTYKMKGQPLKTCTNGRWTGDLQCQDEAVKLDRCEAVKLDRCEAVKLDRCEAQIQQLQNKSQDQAVKLDTCEAHIQQLQKKSQDEHTLLRELRTELALLRNKMEALEQNQTQISNPCKFLLDPNTGSRYLRLSDDLRTVTYVGINQSYPDHRDRFTGYVQVLSSYGLRGRCYWEVDWRLGKGWGVEVAVSYRRICRGEESECRFGQNDHSWSLTILRGGKGSVRHNNYRIDLPGTVGVSSGTVGVSSGTVGVSLDWEGGALSFYDVTNGQRSHLHTFNSSFTEELLPGFYLYGSGSSVSVVELNRG